MVTPSSQRARYFSYSAAASTSEGSGAGRRLGADSLKRPAAAVPVPVSWLAVAGTETSGVGLLLPAAGAREVGLPAGGDPGSCFSPAACMPTACCCCCCAGWLRPVMAGCALIKALLGAAGAGKPTALVTG